MSETEDHTMKRLAAFLHCILLAGCSVTAADDQRAQSTKNSCSQPSDCGGGVCVRSACQAVQGQFGTVLFDVTAPADANTIAGARFIKRIGELDLAGGKLDLTLGRIADVSGTFSPAKALDQTCTFEGGTPSTTVQARITFTLSERPLGLPIPTYTTTTHVANGAAHGFEIKVPPGEYDIYVQDAASGSKGPADTATATSLCPIVPKLIRRVPVEPGKVVMPLVMRAPARLDLKVIWSQSNQETLQGWSIDIVEPTAGKVISTAAWLKQPLDNEYLESLYYSPIDGPSLVGLELVRFKPPDGTDAPTILLQRSSLELFVKGQGIINQFSILPSPIDFEGRVERKSTGAPVAASVLLVATELAQVQRGTLASFKQTVQTDAQGRFFVKLLPGKYKVQAVPAVASGAAATTTTLEIAESPAIQAGKLIEVADLTRISGTVVGVAGQPITGASVTATATPLPIAILDAALGAEPFLPRASSCSKTADGCSTSTARDGYFSVDADPGAFDVSIRPSDDSGFSWFVKPNVNTADDARDLGMVNLPLPVAYYGHVSTDDAGVIPGALIRAFIYVDDNSHAYVPNPSSTEELLPSTVVQIAETRAADDGSFELRLPAQLGP